VDYLDGKMLRNRCHQLRLSDDERPSADTPALLTQVFLSAEERDEYQ
jgi:hypothetical protein